MDCLAVLYPFNAEEVDIRIDRKEFLIGRAKNASYDIKDLSVSRNQCVLTFNYQWTLCDKSSAGTWLNGKRMKNNVEVTLRDGDQIKLGDTEKFNYVFCVSGQECPNSCHSRTGSKACLDAEMAQRRRLFEFNATLQKDGLEKSILEKQHDRQKLEQQQKVLRDNFNFQLLRLEERNRQLHNDLEFRSKSVGNDLLEEKERLEKQLEEEKLKLEAIHVKETSELASKISSFEAAETELKKENQALLERLEQEKLQFEARLQEERSVLEAKFVEQLAEQQRLAAEKSQVEEALRLRIQEMEKMAHRDQEVLQQRQVERVKEEERLSKEKQEFEERLAQLQKTLEEKERLEKEREKEFQEKDQELKAQEELREQERLEREAKMEEEFLARKMELENLEKERLEALDKRKEEVTKELRDREAELKRKAEEHERELELQRQIETERLRKELEEKEEAMRHKLECELIKLQEEKVALEMNIRGELDKKEGENAENLEKLTSELNQVKKDLDTTSSKRTFLEKQLVEASQAQEAASKSELEARKAVIENFGDLVESELQCSICNELFVVATTLNCNHTFCQMCIGSWLEKKKEKKDCPICRALITQQSRSLVLDNFIDRMVDNLSEDLKKRRKEIVEERRVLAHVAGLVTQPNKKRKTSVGTPNPPHNAPLQIINGNVVGHTGGLRVLLPVTSLPPGAQVIQIPASSINRGVLTAPSTLPAPTHPGPAAPRTAPGTAASLPPRQQPLQQPHPPSGPPSSSATTATTRYVPHHPLVYRHSVGTGQQQQVGYPVAGQPQQVRYPVAGQQQQVGYPVAGQQQQVGYAVAGQQQQVGYPVAGQPQHVRYPVAGQQQQVGHVVAGQQQQVRYPVAGQQQQVGYPVAGQQQQVRYPVAGQQQQVQVQRPVPIRAQPPHRPNLIPPRTHGGLRVRAPAAPVGRGLRAAGQNRPTRP